jgi:hypothetical protein
MSTGARLTLGRTLRALVAGHSCGLRNHRPQSLAREVDSPETNNCDKDHRALHMRCLCLAKLFRSDLKPLTLSGVVCCAVAVKTPFASQGVALRE